MLKITAIGNLTNDVELKTLDDGRPYSILRIASDRLYRAKDGSRFTDFISIKVRGRLAERCAAFAYKGCKLAASGDFETIPTGPDSQPGFLIKANDVEFSSPKRPKTPPLPPKQTRKMPTAKCLKAPRLPDEKHRHRVQQHRPDANRAARTCRTAPSSDGGAAWRFGGGPAEKWLLRAHHCQ